jgi:DNA-binding transcriptional MocR family regulator
VNTASTERKKEILEVAAEQQFHIVLDQLRAWMQREKP